MNIRMIEDKLYKKTSINKYKALRKAIPPFVVIIKNKKHYNEIKDILNDKLSLRYLPKYKNSMKIISVGSNYYKWCTHICSHKTCRRLNDNCEISKFPVIGE